jgi:hypothetical protein
LSGIVTFTFWRLRRAIAGPYAHGRPGTTPVEALSLQPGEWVEIKPLDSIIATLNEHGNNRGLRFSPDMGLLCGRRMRVRSRIDRIITDGTGEMRQLRNTVCLEGSLCGCEYLTWGGCSRSEVVYWREIWLRRDEAASQRQHPS